MRGRGPTDVSAFDESVVARIMSGHPFTGTIRQADRAEVIRRMTAAGYSDGQIAYALRTWRRSVIRIRQRLNLAPAYPATGANQLDLQHPLPVRPGNG